MGPTLLIAAWTATAWARSYGFSLLVGGARGELHDELASESMPAAVVAGELFVIGFRMDVGLIALRRPEAAEFLGLDHAPTTLFADASIGMAIPATDRVHLVPLLRAGQVIQEVPAAPWGFVRPALCTEIYEPIGDGGTHLVQSLEVAPVRPEFREWGFSVMFMVGVGTSGEGTGR
jgi:hypothetical protein